MTEDQLQGAIIDLALALRWLAYHTYDSRRSRKGFPDLVLVKRPRIVFAELKDAKRQLTDEQLVWGAELASSAEVAPTVEYAIWRPVDWTTGRIEAVLQGRPA